MFINVFGMAAWLSGRALVSIETRVVISAILAFLSCWMNEWMNEYDLSDAITETVAGALNKIKF